MTDPASIFRLDEYGTAGRRFIGDAIHALAQASSPLLAQMTVEQVEAIPVTRTTLDDGGMLEHEPQLVQSMMVLDQAEGIDGDFDGLHAAISKMAAAFSAQLVPNMLQHVSDVCEAVGNVVDGSGEPFWETYLRGLETMEISFDFAGEPRMPQIAMSPTAAVRLPPKPDGFDERLERILTEKRDEWLATRRTRRLSLDRL